MRTYTETFKQKVLTTPGTRYSVAKKFKIAPQTVYNWQKQAKTTTTRTTDTTTPLQYGSTPNTQPQLTQEQKIISFLRNENTLLRHSIVQLTLEKDLYKSRAN